MTEKYRLSIPHEDISDQLTLPMKIILAIVGTTEDLDITGEQQEAIAEAVIDTIALHVFKYIDG